MRTAWLPAVFLGFALLLGLLAAAIWFISAAHGHGLASGDRKAITVLTLGSVASLAASVLNLARR